MATTGDPKLEPRARMANSHGALKALVVAARVLGRVSPGAAAPIASVLWFTPWRVPISERGLTKQQGWVRDTQRLRVKTEAGGVSVRTAGTGPAVLLVHGWGEQGAMMGGFIQPLVAAGYRVVAIDLPAHGRSNGGKTNLIHSGQAIAGVAAHFGGAYAIVAHSMGANAALYAMSCGLRPNRTVLLAPNLELDYAFNMFGQMFGLDTGVMSALKERLERRFGRWVWRDLRADALAHELPVPTLVFHDPEDPQVPFDGSVHLVKAWRFAELVEKPGLGHGPITRDPSVIEQAVAFISKRPTEVTLDADPSSLAAHPVAVEPTQAGVST